MDVVGALLGWVLGALVNYLSDVLPYHRRLVRPVCLHCQQVMGWRNYLIWPRQCLSCTQRRSIRTWVVEIIFIVSTLGIFFRPPERLGITLSLLWLIYFGVIIVIDIEHHLILHPVSWAGAGIGLLTGVWLHGWMGTIIGGVAGFGIMFIFYWLGIAYVRYIVRRRGEKLEEGDAFGFGDVNLSGVIGLLLGWPGILAGLFVAILFSGAYMVFYILGALIAKRFKAHTALPYGPFLAASAIYLLFLR